MPATNPYAPAAYTGDGSTAAFAVPFPFIRRSDVYVTVNGAAVTVVWTSSNVVSISPAPASGSSVAIARSTAFSPDVIFNSGALKSKDLNTVAVQALYVLQELLAGPTRTSNGVSPVIVIASDSNVLVNNAAAMATTVQLIPAYGAVHPISVKDFGSNAAAGNITILPAPGETIDGRANFVIDNDGGAVSLHPLPGIGWFIK